MARRIQLLVAAIIGGMIVAMAWTATAGAQLPVPTCAAHFIDIEAEEFYTEGVAWLFDEGLTTGSPAGSDTYKPLDTMTRGELATFLWRSAGSPAATVSGQFVDVEAGKFYEVAVYWMLEQGITTGKTPTTFAPGDLVTRGELATFLWRFAGQPAATVTGEFVDVASGAFYEVAVYWMLGEDITTGTSSTTFSPLDGVTRAQLAAFLWRFDGEPLPECIDETNADLSTLATNIEALVAASEDTYPWMREAWNYTQVYTVVEVEQIAGNGGVVGSTCGWTSETLPECRSRTFTIDPQSLASNQVLIHELGHVYDRTTELTGGTTWGIAQLYMAVNYDLVNCPAGEFTADAMTHLVDGSLFLFYYESGQCDHGHLEPTVESETVLTAGLDDETPAWFASTYGNGAALWSAIVAAEDDAYLVSAFAHEFGGYCSDEHAMEVWRGLVVDDNPFVDGGC